MKIKKGYKRCSKCGKIVKANLDNFYRDASSCTKDGLSNNCRDCQKEYAYNWTNEHYEYFKKYVNLKNKLKNSKMSFQEFSDTLNTLKDQYQIQ